MIWFPKGGVEEEKGENVFSFLMNVKLTEPKVKLVDLTLVFSVEGDTWCLCSLSKHAYPIFYFLFYSILFCQNPTEKHTAQAFF